ncbi:hypothetical protein PIB30_001457 [Stylosanthes scabra]|uniref:F-box domain-containing protein n=1 Tax=Stylosanthes scabra TaxID=79078 RepID=A0ABU6Q2H1_9FABA|nr:hypothetical protein [Stylosanthes scabra]
MEEKEQRSNINEILPLELIQIILLRVPAKHLARLRFVSKLWHSLISDPHFAKLHFNHSPAATNTNACLYKRHGGSVAYFVYLDALFGDDNDASSLVKEVSLPFEMKEFCYPVVLGSCRGFVLLDEIDRDSHFLVVWNPLTGSGKKISNPYASPSDPHGFGVSSGSLIHMYGFGYLASHDDYFVVVGWKDVEWQPHMDCFSLRSNSWINIDAALPKPLGSFESNSCGLFLNGAIHWLYARLEDFGDAILILDLKERTFSRISTPEQLVMSECAYMKLTILAGCLALYYQKYYSLNTEIWVMKEYKVQSSWTLYEIPSGDFRPLCISNNGDIIGDQFLFDNIEQQIKFSIYNVSEGQLQRFKHHCFKGYMSSTDAMYTESLLPLPTDIKDKKKKERKEIGHQVRHECFEQLDIAKG